MPTDIIMPQLGESIAEGTIVKWLIPPGGRVEKDQSLLEVETDKVALEIPSPGSGVLIDVRVQEGEKVPVGTLLARLDAPGTATGVVNRVGGVVVRPTASVQEDEHYSPAVRQLAKEHGIDLAQVTGTGAGGRVTKKDVLDFVTRKAPPEKAALRGRPSAISVTPTHPSPLEHREGARPLGREPVLAGSGRAGEMTPGVGGWNEGKGGEDKILPFTAMRKMIADRMVKSRQTSAHVVTFFEADFSGIAQFRAGRDLTYLPFVINGVTRAMKDQPILNSSWGEQGIVLRKAIHIGIAVAMDDGLLVPVVRNADRKSLTQLAREVADLAERARTKRLNPEEVQEGTFTITNHGGFGSLFSTPIIHQPQIAILGVGSVQKRAVVINDAIAIRPMCYLSLSFDHRVIDGATADRFMSQVKTYLEQSKWESVL